MTEADPAAEPAAGLLTNHETYDAPIRVGLALLAASVLLWPLAAWRRW